MLAICLGGCSANSVGEQASDTPPDYASRITSGLNSPSFVTWKHARSMVQSEHISIAAVGDSTTAGWGSGGNGATNARAGSWPTLFAQDLSAAGLPARSSSFFGDGGFLAKLTAADPRVSMASNWVASPETTLGGYPFAGNSTAGEFRFTPEQDFDTVVVYDGDGPKDAPMSVKVDGDDESASNILPPLVKREGAGITELQAMRGHHAVTVAPTFNDSSYGQMRLIGIDTYDSTAKDVSVHNLGFSGSTTVDWTKTDQPLAVLAQLKAKLTFIDLGLNDMSSKMPVATFRANLKQIALAAAKSGSVVLVIPNRSNPGYVSDQTQDQFDAAILSLGAELQMPVVSLPKLLGTFAAAKAGGMMSDDVHLSAKGYALVAEALSQVAMVR